MQITVQSVADYCVISTKSQSNQVLIAGAALHPQLTEKTCGDNQQNERYTWERTGYTRIAKRRKSTNHSYPYHFVPNTREETKKTRKSLFVTFFLSNFVLKMPLTVL